MTKTQAGFTLLETLLGLTLLGFLFTGIFGGFSAASKALRRTEAHVERIEGVAVAQDFLRAELSRAYPQIVGATPAQEEVDFAGAPDRLRFLAPLPARYGAADIAQWTLAVTDGALRLAWRLDRDPPAGFPAEMPADTILLRGVTGLKIGYFGPDGPGTSSTWHEDWRGRRALPELIRVQVTPDSLGWPELFVAPRPQIAADCFFDPSDPLGCRRR